MSHFNLEREINNATRLDGAFSRAPLMRWQKKVLGGESITANSTNASLNMSTSFNTTKSPKFNRSLGKSCKTPNDKSRGAKTPKSVGRQNCRTPAAKHGSPNGKKTPKTPGLGADRFIPSRSGTNLELGNYLVTNAEFGEENPADLSPGKAEYQRILRDNLQGDLKQNRILKYQQSAPAAPEGYQNGMKILYSASRPSQLTSQKQTSRHIPSVAERILDAPEIVDDYYINVLDVSCSNVMAVALGPQVYLWDSATGNIDSLPINLRAEDYVTSLSFVKEGNVLAIGTYQTVVQLWDISQQKRMRTMTGHASRVSALSWNSYVLSSGSRSGAIHHHDVRVAEHQIASIPAHVQEVCGLEWSPDGRFLASGGNDNMLCLWPNVITSSIEEAKTPLYKMNEHSAAVKALAWCPWQPSLLASGGGTADRCIRIWNCNSGICLKSVDTKSQVCTLVWSEPYKELVSGHGYSQYQITLWKYPHMTKVAEITGHEKRILHMGLISDGSRLITAAADETIRIWHCFGVDPKQQKKPSASNLGNTGIGLSSAMMR